MIRIRNESDLENWFKKNYKTLGFTAIARQNIGKFPDFIMIKNDKKVRVELEFKSSNFLVYKHPIDKVDLVICAINDIILPLPTIKIDNVKIIDFDEPTRYSNINQMSKVIDKYLQREIVATSMEIAKALNVSWNTADRCLTELLIGGKIIRKKKEGVNLWLRKLR